MRSLTGESLEVGCICMTLDADELNFSSSCLGVGHQSCSFVSNIFCNCNTAVTAIIASTMEALLLP